MCLTILIGDIPVFSNVQQSCVADKFDDLQKVSLTLAECNFEIYRTFWNRVTHANLTKA